MKEEKHVSYNPDRYYSVYIILGDIIFKTVFMNLLIVVLRNNV